MHAQLPCNGEVRAKRGGFFKARLDLSLSLRKHLKKKKRRSGPNFCTQKKGSMSRSFSGNGDALGQGQEEEYRSTKLVSLDAERSKEKDRERVLPGGTGEKIRSPQVRKKAAKKRKRGSFHPRNSGGGTSCPLGRNRGGL